MALSALSATGFTVGKFLLQYAPPFGIIGLRMIGAGIIFITYSFLKDPRSIRIAVQDLVIVVFLGLCAFCVAFCAEFWALQYLFSAKACFLYNLAPFSAALFSYIYFGEKITPVKFLGFSVGLLGFIPVLMISDNYCSRELLFRFSWPEVVMIIAVLTFTYGWVLFRTLQHRGYISRVINGYGMCIGGIAALGLSYGSGESLYGILTIPALMSLGSLIIINNLIVYSWYGRLLEKYTATYVTCAEFSSPIFVALYGYLLLGEPFSWAIIASTGIVFLGFWLIYTQEFKQGYYKTF